MPLRPNDIAAVLAALAAGGSLACRAAPEAVEVNTPSAAPDEASCRHELGRCGGHKPGDGACAAGEAPVPQDIFTALAVAPGGFAEINLQMAKGAAVTARFTGSAPLAWNVHSHAGDRVLVHAEGSAAADSVRFVAEQGGAYSYVWQNKGDGPITLDVALRSEGDVSLHSTHPAR